jgi:phosphoribosylaminoimidazole-succinocarboxamide synthase
MKPNTVLKTSFPNLKLFAKGKVRDIYEVGDYLLLVSTDRISAFDVIMDQGIPYKGMVLTKISEFWFNYTKDIIPNHMITTDVEEYPSECKEYADELNGRSMLVKKAKVIPIECIVRGYISGSGWKDYKNTGAISGIDLQMDYRNRKNLMNRFLHLQLKPKSAITMKIFQRRKPSS